jgi:hypothetical protein
MRDTKVKEGVYKEKRWNVGILDAFKPVGQLWVRCINPGIFCSLRVCSPAALQPVSPVQHLYHHRLGA